VVKVPRLARAKLEATLAAFRITDSVAAADGNEIHAVLDGKNLDRDGLQRRLCQVLADVGPAFGWATFPDDGITLDGLVEQARGSFAPHAAAVPSRPARVNGHGGRHGDRALSRVLVTGCAGFLGSHLSERLVADGVDVIGVDCFTDYYPRAMKEANLQRLLEEPRFELRELDLSADDLSSLFDGVDTVVHLAAQPGVRSSFGAGFEAYLRNNVRATQRLLEEAARWPLGSFTYASSSSVYGDAASYPTNEQAERRPVSPYGMTKVSTEELAAVYRRCFGVPVVGLRFFTAYGPRQRPDMAFTRFLSQALAGEALSVLGDGTQVREFTYVDDVIEATIAAARRGRAGGVYNVGGGSPVELRHALGLIEGLIGRPLDMEYRPSLVGEARMTACDGSLAALELGFRPRTDLRTGISNQLEWLLDRAVPDVVAVERVGRLLCA
jgi:nucleoside-diphosphate-sugar epimerase